MNFLALICLLFLLKCVVGIKIWTRNTSAESARLWAIAAVLACVASVACQWPALGVSPRDRSAVQYLAAVMLLTPFIAILGARRPGANAWPWFVVLPLVVVLQWPSISQLMAGHIETAIEVPTPTLIGFVFVLIMGTGNYFGTLNTGSALMCAVGTLLTVLPLTDWMSAHNTWALPVGCVLLAFAASLLPGRYTDDTETVPLANREDSDLDQLWTDFRDLYGIVWAKRVMDRVNQFAAREHWDVRLNLYGFVIHTNGQATKAVADRPIEILCWVLRRFVDPPFLLRYLPNRFLTARSAVS